MKRIYEICNNSFRIAAGLNLVSSSPFHFTNHKSNMDETASTSSSGKVPIFICMAIMEEGGIIHQQQHQQQPTASSSSGVHSGGSPPPSMSSGASSASQDSAICASSLTTTSSSSPLPPPDPGQDVSGPSNRSQNATNSGGGIGQNQNPILLHLAWISLDPLNAPDLASNEAMAGIVSQQYKLDTRNALDQLKKISNEIEQRNSDGTSRQNWLMCSRRSIRQSLYPFCAQALLAKLTEGREEQVFSATLPLPPIFHRFLPFPLMNSLPPSECCDLQQNIMMENGNGGGLNGQNGAILVDELLERRLSQMAIALMESSLWQTATKSVNGAELEAAKWMEPVQQGYRPALCLDGHAVNPRTIVRARGLPWQVSDLDVALFFAGLDIAKGGIALCLGPEGRRNGECLIRFERPEHRDWALERHRRHLRQRYIEVYRAGADEFVRHAVGTDRFAVEFAQRAEQQWNNYKEGGHQQNDAMSVMIVRMRGLPFTATEQQIRDFFASDGMPSGILDQGVLFVHRPDGRPSGDAFVLFGDEQSGRRALQKHRQRMGNRYIELFRTTQAEVQQLFNARQQAIAAMNGVGGGTGNINQQQQRGGGATALLQQTLPVLALGGGMANQQHQTNGNEQQTNGNNGNVVGNGHGGQQQQQHRQRDCLRLRGLPYEAQVQQVVEFMGPQHARHVLFQGVHMIYNAAGHPSGEAFIQMESEQAAGHAAQECHNKFMELGKKKRYIEVFQCCAEDMSLLLNVLPTPAAGSTTSAQQIMPPSAGGILATPNGGPLPPLIPLAAGPFPPQNGAPGPAVPPLLAFPTTTGQFLPPTTLGISNDSNGAGMATAAILMPQFAAPFAHLYSPETAAHFVGHSAPPSSMAEFWLRNGFAAATAGAFRNTNGFHQTMAAAPNTFAPTPLFAPTQLATVNGGTNGAAHFGGPTETAVKLA